MCTVCRNRPFSNLISGSVFSDYITLSGSAELFVVEYFRLLFLVNCFNIVSSNKSTDCMLAYIGKVQ